MDLPGKMPRTQNCHNTKRTNLHHDPAGEPHSRACHVPAREVANTVISGIATWLRDEEAVQHESAAADAIQYGPDRLSQPRRPPQRPRSTTSPVVRIERVMPASSRVARAGPAASDTALDGSSKLAGIVLSCDYCAWPGMAC